MRREGWLERDLVGDTSHHEPEVRLWLERAAKASLRGRGFLLAAVAVVVVACLLRSVALRWAIPTVFVARFAILLLTGRARQEAGQLARRGPIDLPAAESFSEDRARRLIERLERARQQRQSAIGSRPAGAAFEVSGLVDPTQQMERDIVVLAARIEYLGRFLQSSPQMGLLAEITELEGQRPERDAEASKEFDRLIGQCHQHIDLLNHLTERMNEACATAEVLLRAIEQVPARMMSLQLARIESCDARSVEASREAAAMSESFSALERATADLRPSDASPS